VSPSAQQPDFKFVSYELDGRVATVTIRRPEARNALHQAAHAEMDCVWRRFEEDDDAWVAILTGEGDKAFCAGSDLKQAQQAERPPQPYWLTFKPGGFGGLTERFGMVKPVIAAVNGFALGGGCELAMACDIVVAAQHARFGLPEPRVGFTASDGGIHRLVRQVPLKIAMGVLLTGMPMSADEAHRWGLVNEVVPAEELMPAARRWADAILECAPLSVRASKQAALGGLGLPLADAINRRYEYMLRQAGSVDSREGPTAFAEKRKPVWKGM
jgi:enoyl-CoA hydratase/carnithine racemase